MPADAPTTTADGTVLAERYRLGRLIARGGMADVFEARDEVLDRRVAVKVFRAAEAAHRERFDAEVRLLAGLNHPGLVAVYDAGEQDGDGFMVLELVEGPTLRTTLRDRAPLPSDEVAAVGATLADALAHVHERGIVHRDLTPANVLCGPDGTPRLTDFGIARLLDTTRVTAEHLTIGTVGYMAPEQVEGKDVTPAADVYALGLVLLEALTGAPAFTGPSHEVAVARLTRDPAVPADLDEPWPGLLRSMTARQPADRPSAAEVATTLRRRPHPSAAVAPAAAAFVGVGAPGGTVRVPGDETADPQAETAALPISETGPVPEGSSAGRAPTKTTVMPAALRPTPPPDDTTSGLAGATTAGDTEPHPPRRAAAVTPVAVATAAGAAAAEVTPAGAATPEATPAGAATPEATPAGAATPEATTRGAAPTDAATGGGPTPSTRPSPRLSPRQWTAVAVAGLILLLAWLSGGGFWRAQVLQAQSAALEAAQETSTTAAPETTTTTVAPAPPPAPPEEGPDEGRGNGTKGRDEGKGNDKKGKDDGGDDD